MAFTLGTECGFVTAAPTNDPGGAAGSFNRRATGTKDTCPANYTKITEMGFYCATFASGVNFEIGLYSHDSSSDEPETLLWSDKTNTIEAGWNVISGLDIAVTPGTVYWLCIQGDAAANSYDYSTCNGARWAYFTSNVDTLPDPTWSGSTELANYAAAIYALVEVGSSGTNCQINIGDDWKAIEAMQINIGDTWKAVAGAKINIGDAWKTIF